jgi:membrane-associated phospholipid phosphatase
MPCAFRLRLPPPPSSGSTRGELSELRALAALNDDAAVEQVRYWDAGAPGMRWIDMANAEIVRTATASPRAARIRALVNVAAYDATIAAWDSKYAWKRRRPSALDRELATVIPTPPSPSYPSEHAAVAGAASTVLAYVFPARAQFFVAQAEAAAESRVKAGVHYRSDVAAGLDLGRRIGALAVERAAGDGSDAKWTGTVPSGKGKWSGTNPAEPMCGTWRTWVLSSGSQFRPSPPPAFDSAQEAAELAEVKGFPRTFATNEAAMYWQGTRFAGYYPLATAEIAASHLDTNPPRAARVYALMSVASYDAVVACWDAKYTYWAIRPNQLDPSVTTLFPTPNHPSYPSAHSCNSGATAEVLSNLFPGDADMLRAQGQEAANSRLWAGIHFKTDDETGLALGRAVAKLVMERAQNDGSQ